MAGFWKKIRRTVSSQNVRNVIFNPENSMLSMVALFIMEIFINVWVIRNIRCKLDVSVVILLRVCGIFAPAHVHIDVFERTVHSRKKCTQKLTHTITQILTLVMGSHYGHTRISHRPFHFIKYFVPD